MERVDEAGLKKRAREEYLTSDLPRITTYIKTARRRVRFIKYFVVFTKNEIGRRERDYFCVSRVFSPLVKILFIYLNRGIDILSLG